MIETVSEFLERRSRELAERVGVLQGELNALSAELAAVERCLKAVAEPVAVESVIESLKVAEAHFYAVRDDQQPEPAPVIKGRGYSNLILKRLPGWMREYPAGPTIKQVAAKCKVSASAIHEAFLDLRDSGRAVVRLGREDNLLRVAPLGHVSPLEADPEPTVEPVILWRKRPVPSYQVAGIGDGVRDVSPLIFGDPSPERSALGAKQRDAAARKDLNGQ